jgi:hypothetical protein
MTGCNERCRLSLNHLLRRRRRRASRSSYLELRNELQIFIRMFHNARSLIFNWRAFSFDIAIIPCKDILIFYVIVILNLRFRSFHLTYFLEFWYLLSHKHGRVAGLTLSLLLSRHKGCWQTEEVSRRSHFVCFHRCLIIAGRHLQLVKKVFL